MNGCVYKTADGQCEKFSDPARNTMSWCLDGPCGDETPSNAWDDGKAEYYNAEDIEAAPAVIPSEGEP